MSVGSVLIRLTRLARRLAVPSILLGAMATPAQADDPFAFDYYCVMGSFQVCASVRLQSDGNTLKMQVWNLHGILGASHTITALGLYHLSSDWAGEINSYTVTHNGLDITDHWQEGAASIEGGRRILRLELATSTTDPETGGDGGNAGIIGCLDPGGQIKWPTCRSFDDQPYVEFTFNLSQHFALSSDLGLKWHSQQLPDGSSVRCDTYYTTPTGDHLPCVQVPPPVVVPEPATLVLLGTGFAGIAGAARRRRKSA